MLLQYGYLYRCLLMLGTELLLIIDDNVNFSIGMIMAWSCLRRGPTPLDSFLWMKLLRRKPGNLFTKLVTENILTLVADPDPRGAHSFEFLHPYPGV
jgi:hypothetical protein